MDLPELGEFKITQQPAVRLPSTHQIDARIQRQTQKLAAYIEDRYRLKQDGGRRLRGPRRTKPPNPVFVYSYEGDNPGRVGVFGTAPTLVFHRDPDRRHPDGTDWIVPCEGLHPKFGPCYHLDGLMVMWQQLLRTIPRRRLLVSRGPTPAESIVFKALSQEWVRSPSGRRGYHRWLCYVVSSPQRDDV